jgi:hypothetical protein
MLGLAVQEDISRGRNSNTTSEAVLQKQLEMHSKIGGNAFPPAGAEYTMEATGKLMAIPGLKIPVSMPGSPTIPNPDKASHEPFQVTKRGLPHDLGATRQGSARSRSRDGSAADETEFVCANLRMNNPNNPEFEQTRTVGEQLPPMRPYVPICFSMNEFYKDRLLEAVLTMNPNEVERVLGACTADMLDHKYWSYNLRPVISLAAKPKGHLHYENGNSRNITTQLVQAQCDVTAKDRQDKTVLM